MDDRLKKRLVGALVLVLAGVILVPMLLDQSEESRQQPAPLMPLPEDEASRNPPAQGSATTEAPRPLEAVVVEKPPAWVVAAPAPAEPATLSGFAVQLGSFSKGENAMGLRDKLVASGYTAFVKTTGSVTRVYVGPQRDRAATEKMLKKLQVETKLKGIVVNFSE